MYDRARMTDAQIRARHAFLVEQESRDPLGWWWLSFVGDRPDGSSGFLGVAIVEGRGIITAIDRAHDLGINPGGEVRAWWLPVPPAAGYTDRLLTSDEADAAQPDPA